MTFTPPVVVGPSRPDISIPTPTDAAPARPASIAPATTPAPISTSTPARLDYPPTVDRRRIRWSVAFVIFGIHLLALAAFVPWLFTWSAVVAMLVGVYAFGTLGINLCYHRLLTHRGFKVPRWLEHTFATFGMCSLEGSPATWVASHRMHHQHADHEADPHSPLVEFFWSHMSWLMVENRALNPWSVLPRYARDVCRDRFYLNLERRHRWLMVYPIHAILITAAGALWGWAASGTLAEVLRTALSWLVWAVLLRTVIVWHITWSVNSFTHLFGYRNYETNENSRNNWIVALLSNGEGWHNNHHADQRSAAHGHKWWEFDVTFITIMALRRVGLAREVVQPRHKPHRKV
ncbi:MAG: acyl-CoA desaturase [Phycisphaerales bacterium]